jgi:hypothetical protein
MGTPISASPNAMPRASVVQGTLAIQGSMSVHNSYDGRVNCGDGVRSDQSVTLHLSLTPRRIIIASALGAASGTVMGGASSVTIGQNAFEYSPPSCNGDAGAAFGEAPTAPICEPSQGKAMIMLTQNPPPGTLEPVPLQYPRLHLIVSAADSTGGLNADCPQYWPQLGSGAGEITGLSLGESRLWSMYLPSGLQVKGATGLAKAHKGAKIRRVINVTGPCEAMVGTASPARSRPEAAQAEGEPHQSCEMSGRFLLTFTKR